MKDKRLRIIILAIILIAIAIIIACFCLRQKTYEVAFRSNGEVVNTTKVKSDEKVAKPEDLEKEGYIFEGWYYKDEKFNFDTPIKENITLEARWSKVGESNKIQYTINFDTKGGNQIESQTIEKGEKVTTPKTPTRNGYTFVGWYLEDKKFDFDTTIDKDITLTAKWKENKDDTKNEETSKPSGNTSKPTSNNNSKPSTNKPTTNKPATDKPTTDKPTTNQPAEPQKPVTPTKYTVTFNSNGGSAVASQSVESGKNASKPSNPTKGGYTFLGWYLGSSKYNFATAVTGNITLTAKWEKNAPVVTYTFDPVEGSIVNQKIIYVLKDGVRVNGSVTITTVSGKTVTVKVPSTGLIKNGDVVAKISNPKAD